MDKKEVKDLVNQAFNTLAKNVKGTELRKGIINSKFSEETTKVVLATEDSLIAGSRLYVPKWHLMVTLITYGSCYALLDEATNSVQDMFLSKEKMLEKLTELNATHI